MCVCVCVCVCVVYINVFAILLKVTRWRQETNKQQKMGKVPKDIKALRDL